MKPIVSSRVWILAGKMLLIVCLLTACQGEEDVQVVKPSLGEDLPRQQTNTPTPEPVSPPAASATASLTLLPATATATAEPATPTLGPTPTYPARFEKDLLLRVYVEEISETNAREAIWLLSAGAEVPRPLLMDDNLSYKSSGWSRDGNWIAFEQRNKYDFSVEQLGAISVNDEEMKIFEEKFHEIASLGWSATSEWLVFDALTVEGLFPYVLDIRSEEITNLFPESGYDFYQSVTRLSPKDDWVAFAGFSGDFDQYPAEIESLPELWLLSLENEPAERVPLPEGIEPGCVAWPAMEWAPDGKSLLMQFKGYSPVTCFPRLWLYSLKTKTWFEVVRLDSTDFSHNDPLDWFEWSKDGKWVAWRSLSEVRIFSTSDWKLVKTINLGFASFFRVPLSKPWTIDEQGNSLYCVVKVQFSASPYDAFSVYGIDPAGTDDEGRLLLNLTADASWEGWEESYTFSPVEWQP